MVGRGGAGDIHGVSLGRKTLVMPFMFGFLCCGSHNGEVSNVYLDFIHVTSKYLFD